MIKEESVLKNVRSEKSYKSAIQQKIYWEKKIKQRRVTM